MPDEESKPEVPSESNAKTEEPTTEAAAAETEQEDSSAADVVAAAEAAANETEDTSKTYADKFSSVDLIKAYILNNTAAPSASEPSATAHTTGTTGSTSSLVNHLDASMSTLLANGEDSTISTAAAVASIGAEAAGNYPPPNSKLQHLQSLMESKLPPKAGSQETAKTKDGEGKTNEIAMIPLVYSVDRQEAASPTQLSMLSTALQPKSKFKVFPSTGKKRKEKSPSVKNYIDDAPTEKDVLMGRGGRSNHHPGNARYLEAKLTIQPRYRKATKEEKTGISQELVDVVKNWGGRFVKLDDSNQRWYEVDNVTARKKASQTLREENTAESRAQKRAKYSSGASPGQANKSGAKAQAPGLESLAVLANAVSTDVDPEVATAMITTTDTTVDATATPVTSESPEASQQTTV